MGKTATPVSRPGPPEWAAYVLGRHIGTLSDWHGAIWGIRGVPKHKGATVTEAFAPEEMNELADAMDVLSGELAGAPREMYRAGEALASWRIAANDMLRELDSRFDRELDWSNDFPPGLNFATRLADNVRSALRSAPFYRAWFEFGEAVWVARQAGGGMPADVVAKLLSAMRMVEAFRQYAVLAPLIGILQGDAPLTPQLRSALLRLKDPIWDEVTADRVH